MKYSCRAQSNLDYTSVSGRTDATIVASMVNCIPHHDLSQRRQGPHLNLPNTSGLFHMHAVTQYRSSSEPTPVFAVLSESGVNTVQVGTGVRLPPGVYVVVASLPCFTLTQETCSQPCRSRLLFLVASQYLQIQVHCLSTIGCCLHT